jgi:hypothetical protein
MRIRLIAGKTHDTEVVENTVTVSKVEKWTDINVSTSTSIGGGGGTIYQGTGSISAIDATVQTTATSTPRCPNTQPRRSSRSGSPCSGLE